MSGTVRLGIVGLGTIAQTQHIPNLAGLGDRFRIVAVADLSPGLVAAVAGGLADDVATSLDWRDVVGSPAVDAVLLLTPGAHELMTGEALIAGKHVLVEKPLCLTAAGAERLHALAHERDRVLHIAYMKRHELVLDELVRGLALIGEKRLVRHTVYHPTPQAQLTHVEVLRYDDVDADALAGAAAYERIRATEALGDVPPVWRRLYREIVQGSLIHTVSLLRLVLGELPTVTDAELWPSEWLDSAHSGYPSLAVRGSFGSATRFDMRWLWLPDFPQYREVLEIHGTSGSLELELPPPYVRHREATLTAHTREGTARHGGGTDSAFARELEAFHAAVASGDVGDAAQGAAADTAWLQDVVRTMAGGFRVFVGGEAGER